MISDTEYSLRHGSTPSSDLSPSWHCSDSLRSAGSGNPHRDSTSSRDPDEASGLNSAKALGAYRANQSSMRRHDIATGGTTGAMPRRGGSIIHRN